MDIELPELKKASPTQKLILFSITTTFFIIGFAMNIAYREQLFNVNLNVVPHWQNENAFLGSGAFIWIMNLVSNIFNPVVCAGYILLFLLISHRKMEILVFLIWFIFLSFILSILKTTIHQARPYWITGTQIKMLQWTCYTQYGCPSGHSMMGVILLEFVVRFFGRVNHYVNKFIIGFYILAFFVSFAVMLSRVILGMHALNQVLFGFMLGIYTFVPYYLYVENWILQACIRFSESKRKHIEMIIFYCIMVVLLIVMVVLAFTIDYNNSVYWQNIQNASETCVKQAYIYKSFQYKCFQDEAIIAVAFAIFFSIVFMKKPQNLGKSLSYTRLSIKYVARLIVTIIMGVIGLLPVIIFILPFWKNVNISNDAMSIIIWISNLLGFFFAIIGLLVVGPFACSKLNLEVYKQPAHFEDYHKHQVALKYQVINVNNKEQVFQLKSKQYPQERNNNHNSIQIDAQYLPNQNKRDDLQK